MHTRPHPALSGPPSRISSTQSIRDRNFIPANDINVSTSASEDIGLRSLKGLEGLRLAEVGESMVQFDVEGYGNGSCFREGNRIALDPMTPGGGTLASQLKDHEGAHEAIPGDMLPSHDTLLDLGSSSARNAAELKSLLGNSNARLKSGAVILPSSGSRSPDKKTRNAQAVSLEQAKSHARVEVDIILESNTAVQGGYLRGHLKVRIRKRSKKESPVLLAEGKLRVVGFETIPNAEDSYTFYQCAAPLSAVTDASHSLHDSPLDTEGYAQAVEGIHVLPFAMELPLDGSFGNAKGVLSLNSGVVVRYVAMISIKVKDASSGKRSIAHFYRNCEVWPRLNPMTILQPAPRPLQASTAKSLSMLGGDSGKVKFTAHLPRLHWIAGQRCSVKVLVLNGTKKTVKNLTLTLVRTTTLFKPRPALDAGYESTVDPDACQTTTLHKVVAESVLETGQKATKGRASAKGWWTGIKPGQELEFAHDILLPPNALSVTRGRLLEVEYSIRITLRAGSLTSDVFVTLPVRIINFISIDPPPSSALLSSTGAYFRSVRHDGHVREPNELVGVPYPDGYQDALGSSATSPNYVHQPRISFPSTLSTSSVRGIYSSQSTTSEILHVANPDLHGDPPLLPSNSESSVYSSDASVGHDSDAETDFGERRLGNTNIDTEMLGDTSDAEVDFVIESARMEQTTWDQSSDEDDDIDSEAIDAVRSRGAHSKAVKSRTSKRDHGRMEGVGLTSFALRVQEKLVAANLGQSQTSSGTNNAEMESDGSEQATPRVQYHAPRSFPNAAFQVVSNDLMKDRQRAEKPSSRVLPHPPSMANLQSNFQELKPGSRSSTSGASSSSEDGSSTCSFESSATSAPSSVTSSNSHLPLPHPPSMASLVQGTGASDMKQVQATLASPRRPERHPSRPKANRYNSKCAGETRPTEGMEQTGESNSSVKGRIAALEEKVKVAEGCGDAYI